MTFYQELVMLNIFTPHKYFVKIKLSCWKRQWSGKISRIEQNDVTCQIRDMVSKNISQKCSSSCVDQGYLSYTFVKIKWSCSIRRWSGKISEIREKWRHKWRHRSKTRHCIKITFYENVWSRSATLPMIDIL